MWLWLSVTPSTIFFVFFAVHIVSVKQAIVLPRTSRSNIANTVYSVQKTQHFLLMNHQICYKPTYEKQEFSHHLCYKGPFKVGFHSKFLFSCWEVSVSMLLCTASRSPLSVGEGGEKIINWLKFEIVFFRHEAWSRWWHGLPTEAVPQWGWHNCSSSHTQQGKWDWFIISPI